MLPPQAAAAATAGAASTQHWKPREEEKMPQPPLRSSASQLVSAAAPESLTGGCLAACAAVASRCAHERSAAVVLLRPATSAINSRVCSSVTTSCIHLSAAASRRRRRRRIHARLCPATHRLTPTMPRCRTSRSSNIGSSSRRCHQPLHARLIEGSLCFLIAADISATASTAVVAPPPLRFHCSDTQQPVGIHAAAAGDDIVQLYCAHTSSDSRLVLLLCAAPLVSSSLVACARQRE